MDAQDWSPVLAILTGVVATLVAVVPIIAFLWARAKRLEGMVPEWRRHAAGMIDGEGRSGTIRRRIGTAIAVLRGRPLELEVDWGEGQDHATHEDFPHVVALRIPADSDELLLSVGWGDWTWDGKPFPFATMGNVLLHAGDDQGTTVTLTIPVRLAGEALPPEPIPLYPRRDETPDEADIADRVLDGDVSGETCLASDGNDPHIAVATWFTPELAGQVVPVKYRTGTRCFACGARALYDPMRESEGIVAWGPPYAAWLEGS